MITRMKLDGLEFSLWTGACQSQPIWSLLNTTLGQVGRYGNISQYPASSSHLADASNQLIIPVNDLSARTTPLLTLARHCHRMVDQIQRLKPISYRITILTPFVVSFGKGIRKSWACRTSLSSVSKSSNFGPSGRYRTARARLISACARLS